jgi:hypothetical protein
MHGSCADALILPTTWLDLVTQGGFEQRRGRPIRNNMEQMPQQNKPFMPSPGPGLGGPMDQVLANDFNALNLAPGMVKVSGVYR